MDRSQRMQAKLQEQQAEKTALAAQTLVVQVPGPCTLHPAPYTLHPTPRPNFSHPRPWTANPSVQYSDMVLQREIKAVCGDEASGGAGGHAERDRGAAEESHGEAPGGVGVGPQGARGEGAAATPGRV
eukprot:3724485-Rhodomonas_salina.1